MNTFSEKPLITIGFPVYNIDEKFLYTALDSLLNQSYTNFELLISDDCSTDSTSRICCEYAKKDSRIRYIRQKKNLGHLHNFNLYKLMVLIHKGRKNSYKVSFTTKVPCKDNNRIECSISSFDNLFDNVFSIS